MKMDKRAMSTEIRNPNIEIRNKAQIESQIPKPEFRQFVLRILNLFRISHFVFRISLPMLLSSRFTSALAYAAELHQEQERKVSGVPYVAHLLRVAGIVLEYGGNEDEAIAALLHDAVEDQGGMPVLDEIRRRFGDTVAETVLGCSDALSGRSRRGATEAGPRGSRPCGLAFRAAGRGGRQARQRPLVVARVSRPRRVAVEFLPRRPRGDALVLRRHARRPERRRRLRRWSRSWKGR